MKYFFLLLVVCALVSCNNDQQNTDIPVSENEVDAARNFIRAALDGKWNEAKDLVIQDSTNVQLIETAQEQYMHKNREEKRNYREANPILYDSRKVNDSITIVNYANSYMKKRDSLKVVRVNGKWMIDLKYSLLPTDTTHGR